MSDKDCSKQRDEGGSSAELRNWVEFGCWTAFALAPFLYWVNGDVVSQDQLVVRAAVVVFAACGAVGLRIYAFLDRRGS
jgi:hypothetical protein